MCIMDARKQTKRFYYEWLKGHKSMCVSKRVRDHFVYEQQNKRTEAVII